MPYLSNTYIPPGRASSLPVALAGGGWSGWSAVTAYLVDPYLDMHAVLLWADIHPTSMQAGKVDVGVCHRALVANAAGVQSFACREHSRPISAVLARVPAVPISEHPEGASEEAPSRAAWPISGATRTLASALMTTKKKMEICAPCPGTLTKRLCTDVEGETR